jgi:hypothetical protein
MVVLVGEDVDGGASVEHAAQDKSATRSQVRIIIST